MNEPQDAAVTPADGPAEGGGPKNWAEIIRQRGHGFLLGAFKRDWLDPNDPEISRLFPGSRTRTNYEKYGHFRTNGDFFIDGMPGLRLLDQLPHADSKGVFNQLVVGSIDPNTNYGRSIGIQSPHVAFIYTMWTPGYRSATVLRSIFILSEKDGIGFLTQARENRDILEETFQGMYPGMTDRGMKRIKTEELIYGLRGDASQPKPQLQGWRYSRPIGETLEIYPDSV